MNRNVKDLENEIDEMDKRMFDVDYGSMNVLWVESTKEMYAWSCTLSTSAWRKVKYDRCMKPHKCLSITSRKRDCCMKRMLDGLMLLLLFQNPLIRTKILSYKSVESCFVKAGYTKLGDLRSGDGWKTDETMKSVAGFWSLWFLRRIMEEVWAVLPGACREALSQDWHGDYTSPPIKTSAVVQEENEEAGHYHLSTPSWEFFRTLRRTNCMSNSHSSECAKRSKDLEVVRCV